MQEQLINAAHASQWASSWVERNKLLEADLNECANELCWEIDNTALSLQNAAHNVSHKPTIGVFGASQAGKSYLVSKMSAGNEQDLTTTWDGQTIDFIRHVNPQGDQSEATGFATRFTHTKSNAPAGFPVELKIFTELEIAMILVNGFFKDIKQEYIRPKTPEEFLAHLEKLEKYVDYSAQEQFYSFPNQELKELNDAESSCGPEVALNFTKLKTQDVVAGRLIEVNGTKEFNYILPEQVVEFANYVARNSSGKIGSFNDMPEFWNKLRSMLPFMSLQGRLEAFSFFWNDLVVLNNTYKLLASALLGFEGHSKVFAQQEAFVTLDEGRLKQTRAPGGTIMHINKIDYIFADGDSVKCAWSKGPESQEVEKSVSIKSSILAALSLELCFALNNSGEFDDFDVLDFPGARERGGIDLYDVVSDGSSNISDKAKEMLRRGKVEFIFDRYSHRHEIDQLLFCIGVLKQQDVVCATTILTEWIYENISKDKEKRAKCYNPLIVVLTQYDTVFNRGRKSIELDKGVDLDGELKKSFEQLNKVNWFSEWTPGNPFNRVFLARKPNLGSDDTPWLDFDENKHELGISEAAQQDIEAIKQSLLSHEPFYKHIANFEQALERVLTLNDGGVSWIVDEVKKTALKEKERVSLRINRSKQSLLSLLPQLSDFATRDRAKASGQAQQDSIYLAKGLLQCNALCPCFDLLRSLLEIPDARLEEIYGGGFSDGSNVQRFVHEACAEYMDNLASLWRRDNVPLNNLAAAVTRAYEERLPNLQADARSIEAFSFCYDKEQGNFKEPEEFKDDVVALFNKLFDEIGKAFNSSMIGLKNYMVQVLLEQESTSDGYKDVVKIQVQLLQFILSDFNLYLGANLLLTTEDQKNLEQAKSQASASASQDALATPQAQGAVSYGDDDDDFSDFDDFEDDGYDPAPAPLASKSKVACIKGTTISPSKFAMEAAFKGGVFGSKEGPINHFKKDNDFIVYDESQNFENVFKRTYSVDDTEILPHLDELSHSYEFNLISDYVSTLMYIMCKVNVFSQSKYKFSDAENLLLCRILSTMENVK